MHKFIETLLAVTAAAAFAFSAPVPAQQKVKVGFITTLSGPQESSAST